MEKVEIRLERQKDSLFFQGKTIEIEQYISLEHKIILTNNFIETIFSDGDIWTNYISAKYELFLGVVDLCTNISIIDERGDPIISVDDIICSGLWRQIESKIVNLEEFEDELFDIIDLVFKGKSLETDVNKMSKRISDLIDKISNFNSEDLKSVLSEFNKEKENLKKYFPTMDTSSAIVEEKPKRKGRPKKTV